MVEKQTVVFKTINDVDILADVFLPPGHLRSKQCSAVLYLHGGGMVMGDRNMVPEMEIAAFVSQGWVVVSSDYRLVPESTFPQGVEDALDAYLWMQTEGKKRYGIKENQIAIMGSSAGARLALVAGYMTKTPPCCLISLYGQTDFALNNQSWMSLRSKKVSKDEAFSAVHKHGIRTGTDPFTPLSASIGSYLAWAVQNDELLKAYFGDDHDSKKVLEKYSPCLNVHSSYPPTLVVHGRDDTLTPLVHAEVMHQALIKHDIPTKLVIVEG
jgi:acetyl esterase/lipase